VGPRRWAALRQSRREVVVDELLSFIPTEIIICCRLGDLGVLLRIWLRLYKLSPGIQIISQDGGDFVKDRRFESPISSISVAGSIFMGFSLDFCNLKMPYCLFEIGVRVGLVVLGVVCGDGAASSISSKSMTSTGGVSMEGGSSRFLADPGLIKRVFRSRVIIRGLHSCLGGEFILWVLEGGWVGDEGGRGLLVAELGVIGTSWRGRKRLLVVTVGISGDFGSVGVLFKVSGYDRFWVGGVVSNASIVPWLSVVSSVGCRVTIVEACWGGLVCKVDMEGCSELWFMLELVRCILGKSADGGILLGVVCP
jgi:hypothetical protein